MYAFDYARMQKCPKRVKLTAALRYCILAAMTAATRRSYQDYGSWSCFGTKCLWDDIGANPALAGELITQHLACKMLLVNPKETTSADAAAHIVVATHGPTAACMVSDAEVNRVYDWFKARYTICICCVHSSR